MLFTSRKSVSFTSRKVGFLQVENGKTCMILEKSFLKQTARHTYPPLLRHLISKVKNALHMIKYFTIHRQGVEKKETTV